MLTYSFRVLDLEYSRERYGHLLVGTGMTPEGLNQNDVTFHLMTELMWRKEKLDPVSFSQIYIEQRYGNKRLNGDIKRQYTMQRNISREAHFQFVQ